MNEELEKEKYIRLKNYMNMIKTNLNVFESYENQLVSLLKTNFTINNNIADVKITSDIETTINNTRTSIKNVISSINNKI